jgi:hypothetical protein
MVKQENTKIASEISKLNEHESLAVLDYISTLLTKRSSRSKNNQLNDDLVLSLSDAHENKRARQVFEWERVRRQNVQRWA